MKEAIGFNEQRGDRVNVMNVPFKTEAPLPEAEAPSILEQPWLKSVAKQGVAAILVLLLAFVVLKPIMRSLTSPQPTNQMAFGDMGGDRVTHRRCARTNDVRAQLRPAGRGGPRHGGPGSQARRAGRKGMGQ